MSSKSNNTPTQSTKIPVGRYVRSATAPTTKSIRDQERACAKLASSIGGKIIATYSDDATSGLKKDRPNLERMLEDARRGKIKGVIVEHTDRLSRSIPQSMKLIEAFAAAGAPVRAVRRGPAGSTILAPKSSRRPRRARGVADRVNLARTRRDRRPRRSSSSKRRCVRLNRRVAAI
jgi:hypothetical protein